MEKFVPFNWKSNPKNGFTLLELLIVIGILAVLATGTILALNPAEYIRQSRDAKRVSELNSLNKALSMAEMESLAMGSTTTVYVSLPDTSSNCSNLGLPALPSGYSYQCSTSDNLIKTDGTGWIPVNFDSIIGGSPIPVLPLDPINTVSSNNYYSYVPGNSFGLSSQIESEKYFKTTAINDGGTNPSKYEVGSDLSLITKSEGLVGYWKFDGDFNDSSGKNNHGIGYNGTTFTSGKQGQAGSFDGMNDYINAQGGSIMIPMGQSKLSIMAWVLKNNSTGGTIAHQNGPFIFGAGNVLGGPSYEVFTTNGWRGVTSAINIQTSTWYLLAIIYDGSKIFNYVNGTLDGSSAQTGTFPMDLSCLGIGRWTNGGCNGGSPSDYFNGNIDDLRVYNRALSETEIKALYNATK